MRAEITLKAMCAGSATVVSAIAILPVAPAALADPKIPLAPQAANCTSFGFAGTTAIRIDSSEFRDRRMIFTARGQRFEGTAVFGPDELPLSAKIDGRVVTMMNATSASFAGEVADDGTVQGTMLISDGTRRPQLNWQFQDPLECLDPAVPQRPPAGGQDTGTNRRPDRDRDGLFDDDETDAYGTNPDVADTDGDGPDDGQEVFDGTDPNNPEDHV